MPRIAQRTIDAVNDLSIVDVVEHYNITLRRSGSNFLGLCPFHSERTPSFSVSRRLNIAKCFSCGKGGGPVQFVMEHEGLEYRPAVEALAKAFNIPVEYEKDERTDEELAAEKKRESQRICLDVALEFFVEQFYADNPESEAARQYAFSRWEEDYCRLAGIGYAPRSSALLLDFIKRKGRNLTL